MRKTKQIALCAVFSALTVVLLFIAAVVDVMDLTLVAVCSILVIIAHMEMGKPCDIAIWLVSTVISFLILPSKMPVILYFLFGGLYPILKAKLERLPRVLSWILKFVYFNLFITASIALARFVLLLPETDYSFSIPVYLLGNAAFFLYDIALRNLIWIYIGKWRKQLRLDRFFQN